MYQTKGEQRIWSGLRTGDVLKLTNDDFKYLAKHESIKELFNEFFQTEIFKHGYWAIINKPCDMVETKDGSRTFDTNLLLCPLRGFKSALKENILKGFLEQNIKPPRDEFIRLFKEEQKMFFHKQTKDTIKDHYERERRAKDFANETAKRIKELTTTERTTPQLFAAALLEILKRNKFQKDRVISIVNSDPWARYIIQFETSSKQQAKLKLDKNGIKSFASLCLNQFDSKGIFFYEPHNSISNKDIDLSFIIKLDEMISFKIRPDLIYHRRVSEFLRKKKILGLKENFSDRLLNIVGNYFSKIGTSDVSFTPILELYKKTNPGELEYDEKHLFGD